MKTQLFILIIALAFIIGYAIGEDEDYDYLDIFGPAGTIAPTNYSQFSPAFVKFMVEDYPADNVSPYNTPINYSDYTPAFTEFIDPAWKTQPVNYSQFTPAFAEFMNPNWTKRPIDYGQFTPAFEEFMDPNWNNQSPNLADHQPWIIDFLGY